MKKSFAFVSVLLCMAMLFAACSNAGNKPAAEAPAAEPVSTPLQVKAIDDRTLEVTLKSPTPYFLELTAFPTYMPVKRDVVEANGDTWATVPETYIGNGPFKATAWTPGNQITMEKNENYWDAANVGPNKITFHQIEGSVPQFNAYQTGELQFIDDVPTAEVASLKANPEFNIDSLLGTYYVAFNNEKAPFDNPLVRKAFSLAIDRQYLASVIGEGTWFAADAWIPSGMMDGDKDFREVGNKYFDIEAHAANLEAAKAALAEAGYPNGEGLPVIEYLYNDSGIHPQVAEALQNMWGELGATVTIAAQEWTTFLETRKNGEYMVARDGWINDYSDPVGMLDLFVTGGGNNNAKYSNAEYDELIKQIKTEVDTAARMQMLHKAEDMLMNDFAFAPILYYSDPYMIKPELKDGFFSTKLNKKSFTKVKGVAELNVTLGSNDNTMDPAINSSTDGSSMILHAFQGLYRWNSDNAVEPACAESVDISEDGLTYTFHLREGLKWSDGSPLTAEDFVYSWARAVNPDTGSPYGNVFDIIAGYDEAAGK